MIHILPGDIINIIIKYLDNDTDIKNLLLTSREIPISLAHIDYDTPKVVKNIQPCLLSPKYFIAQVSYNTPNCIQQEYPKLRLHLDYYHYVWRNKNRNLSNYRFTKIDNLYSMDLPNREMPNSESDTIYIGARITKLSKIRDQDREYFVVLNNKKDLTIDKNNIDTLIIKHCTNIIIHKNNIKNIIILYCKNTILINTDGKPTELPQLKKLNFAEKSFR